MKVLVTGATGFLGNHVVAALVRRGIPTVVTGRNEDALRTAPWADQVEAIPLDMDALPDNPFNHLGSPTHCIHLAWGGLDNYRSEDHLSVHLPRSREFLFKMLDGGLGNLLVTGTCLEYGMQEGELTEETPAQPDNPYAEAKDVLRRDLEQRVAGTGKRLQWARLFYMYGPGQNPRSLFAQLERSIANGDASFDMSGGKQVRDYLHVTDVANSLADILLHPTHEGIINVCSGINVPLIQLVEEYIAKRSASIKLNLGVYPYPDWEPFRFWGSPRLLNTIRTEI